VLWQNIRGLAHREIYTAAKPHRNAEGAKNPALLPWGIPGRGV